MDRNICYKRKTCFYKIKSSYKNKNMNTCKVRIFYSFLDKVDSRKQSIESTSSTDVKSIVI